MCKCTGGCSLEAVKVSCTYGATLRVSDIVEQQADPTEAQADG